ncbi:Filamin-A [Clonorchis sinensis]|uniref:Filamin-A n=1 Tax=Clonorchis sinensis TaxID=79923 RepID=A0A8T1MP91_CLOSI|nr:Filamin-A [Clonorchis sinensis]
MGDTPARHPIAADEAGNSAPVNDHSRMAEKELAEDAQWKLMQRNTFTRWANEHLKKANMHIDNLETDLCDGLRLAALVEVLTNHKFKQLNKKPTFRTQKLENVTKVLKFLEDHEKLRLVSIDSTHIVDSNMKLILGLIWTLIMHYSISLPMWDGDSAIQDDKGPKQRLLGWIKQKMPEPPVKNFTTDWNSGVAIGALVDSCAPGLCPDWCKWDPRHCLKNATEAMTMAEEWLNVPQLIRPEEMINPRVDEKAMMTYISQFPSAQLKEGAPLRPKLDPGRVRAHGAGLEPKGNRLNQPCRFTVETAEAGSGQLEIILLNPKGVRTPCEVVPDKNASYSCTYQPTMEGEHRVIIRYAGQEIRGSPFSVSVEPPIGDPLKVIVSGPGIQPTGSNSVGRRSYFTVDTKRAGMGTVDCYIVDPQGRRDLITPRITQPEGEGVFLVEYTPKDVGRHQIFVNFGGQKLPNSPYVVTVGPQFNPEFAYATGRGVRPRGIRAQDKVAFQIHTERCGNQAPLLATLVRQNGETEQVAVEQLDKDTWNCSYVPHRPGKYCLRVLYGGVDIQNSPFEIVVGPHKTSAIKATGPGLVAGVVNHPIIFSVSCREQSSKIGFSIEGPSEARMDCFNHGDGTARVTYWVTQPGEYAVHILYEDEDIPGSPYMPNILPDSSDVFADRVRVYGPAIEMAKTNFALGKPIEMYIDDLKEALSTVAQRTLSDQKLDSVLHIECHDALGNTVPVRYVRRADGSIVYSFTPTTPGAYTIFATVLNIPLKGSPYRVNVAPEVRPENVKIWGPGLKECVQNEPSWFLLNPIEAFPGVDTTDALESNPVTVHATDNFGRPVQVNLSRQPDGVYRIEYCPPPNVSDIYFTPMLGSIPVSKSPLHVAVRPAFDTSLVRIIGLEQRVYKASYVKFTVDTSEIDKVGEGVISAILTAPDGERLACQTTNNNDGTYTCSYTPLEEGAHQIDVSYEGVQVPGSPFNIRVIPGCDPNRVKVYGKGLENGPHLCPGESAEFTVDLTGAGQGGLGLAVEGPSEAPIRCRDNRDGTCTVFYTPKEPGQYSIFVRFNDTNVPNSPFYVDVKTKVDPSQVQCYGPGLESGLLRAGWPAYFTVDTKKAGDAKLQVRYTPKPGGETRSAHIQPLGAAAGKDLSQPQHYHKITYTPEAEGLCHIEVLYDGEHVPGSPFLVQIRKSCEPERVRVLGPGVDGPVLASLPATFTVDARDAGMGDLTLGLTDPRGQSVPVRVVPLPVDNESIVTNGAVPSVTSLASGDVSDTGLLSCTYEPYLVGPHNIHVMFAGVEVDNSPFVIQSVPTGRADLCSIEDPISEIVAIETENVIRVNTAKGGTGRLTCQVVQPATKPGVSATLLPVESEENKDGVVSVYYTPKQLGELCVELRFGGQLIPGGEFTQKVVTREEAAKPAKATSQFRSVEFRLPAPRGDADVECMVVRPSGTQQHVTPTINPDDTITIMYDPVEQGMHELHVNGITRAKPGDMRSSTVAMPLQGSPYRFFVDLVATGHITAYGPGLSHGVTNQPAEFTINTKDAGGGGLSLSVEGPSKAEIKCDENDDGTCTVRYYPSAPGDYHVAIKFQDQHISGSPFLAKIIDERLILNLRGDTYTRAQVNLGATSDIALEALGDDISTLTANVRSVSGREEPCVLKRLPNNRLGISFTPKEIGEHLISVYQGGEHITNSPFRIRISEKEIGDPRRVRVTGPGLMSGVANQPNHFTVDTRDAGYAGLSLSIEGPSKAEIDCQDNHDGTCSVMYLPTEPGMYVINVKYADVHVPNSPFTVDVGGQSLSRVTERITRRREASTVTTVGSRCELSLRVADTTLRDMTASVTAPSGDTYPCEIVQVDTDHYNIKFVPQEMGEHLVSVKHKGINIAGSPFQFTVGPITDGVAHKVRATGPNLQRGFTNAINEFTIYTREAGAGTLAIAIEGPSRAGIDCVERADGSSVVSYQVSLPGTYHCSVKFNDVHIPYSPFAIQIADSGRTGRVASYAVPSQVSGLQETAPVGSEEFPSQIGRPVAFTVHHELLGGQVLRARVQTPSGLIEEAGVQQVDRDQFVVRFVPMESGPHFVYVHIVPAEVTDMDVELGPGSPYPPLEGSPFRLVISHQPADPSMVHANGEGLRRGRVGEKNTFFVHTANAGSGVLNVTVDGPSKVTLTTQEQDEGYSFSYVPTAPGSYEISIKYGGNHHINGSPFKAEITGSIRSPTVLNSRVADRTSNVVLETIEKSIVDYQASRLSQDLKDNQADRVRCEGMGLKRADIQGVNYFTVDASDAGTEILLVGICGPTRPFEEVKVNHLGNNRYSVSYRVNEKGRHWLLVKWGDHHVPGSPFTVDVP